ncbi:uncharacterized protein KQ657_002914 [Scheffersomyces spartinae]|uniref:Uncharacterized protein n=1 Tax=Scheffersomyces spartinae TaxID=45513 RepID=A0A9P7V5J6_9ASCO|nr:uncharacterized protein KQ657_002914 [Scheffersomyces spartinae]KAG7191645.1 hypothetical protein KQ657_002914 [Scheffersomyces spartinae]
MSDSFSLSSTLLGHSLDVRSLSAVDDVIISASRDSTGRKWTRASDCSDWSSTVVFQSPTSSFVNAVSANDLWTAFGGKDCIIYLSETHGSGDGDTKTEGFELPGHSSNVCSLAFLSDLRRLISGSWDSTARVWDLESFTTIYTLKGHKSSVWDAKIIDEDTFITASADRTIRLWQNQTEVRQFIGHNDVVRKILLYPDDPSRFASCSNDGTIKVWDIDSANCIQTLSGHESFVYDIALAPTGDIISTGEDRSIRVWRDGVCIQAIRLPCVSVWCVIVLSNGDIAVGGSDNTIRVFTLDSQRVASKDALETFLESVKSSAISEQGLDDLKHTDLPGPEVLEKPGKQEGQIILVKIPATGTIESHQWSSGSWMKIGDVVGAAGNSEGNKKELNGQLYDYVFDVDIEDGAPPLKLPFNTTDNVYTVATKFLADNELPSSYTEEVVRFIMKNTEGVTIGTDRALDDNDKEGEQNNCVAESVPNSVSERSLSVIPVKDYIFFKDYNGDQIIKGMRKFNSQQDTEHQLDDIQLEEICGLLGGDLSSKAAIDLIDHRLPPLFKTWTEEAQLVLYDILRICIPRVSMGDILNSATAGEFIYSVVTRETTNVSVLMMITKVLSNIVGNLILFVQIFVDENGYANTLANTIGGLMINGNKSKTHKHYNALMTNVASFLYNVSVFQYTSKNAPSSSQPLVDIMNLYGDEIARSNSEAAYRLTVALGNVLVQGTAMTVGPPWLIFIGDTYKEHRFVVVAKDMMQLIKR